MLSTGEPAERGCDSEVLTKVAARHGLGKRILIVQYAGDYLSAYQMMQSAGAEHYYGHRYVLDQLGLLAKSFGDTAILCCLSAQQHDMRLPTGVRVIGISGRKHWDSPDMMRVVREFDPTHLVVLGPLTRLIRWGIQSGRRVLCVLADSFEISAIRRFARHGRLVSVLNDPRVEWVGNHGVSSALSLARIGVSRDKILPWDWPYQRTPRDSATKTSAAATDGSLFFAGQVSKRKGVGDLISAVSLLKRSGVRVTARIAGAGEIGTFQEQARREGVGDEVRFLGLVSNAEVVRHMQEAAAVVVPSQHAYPEGLPLTIYEALCARTPIVASDHPMFARSLRHRATAMIYPERKPARLAACVRELLDDPALYAAVSAASHQAWERLQVPLKWGDLLQRWLQDRPDDRAWLRAQSLAVTLGEDAT